MALVSYVDILEVVGELSDFKTKLVEGEQIAQSGGVTDLLVKEEGHGVWNISAQCQRTESTPGKITPNSVSVTVVSEPRLLDCQCSCLSGKSGKCQHVVATLMHIHRNNITPDSTPAQNLIPEAGRCQRQTECIVITANNVDNQKSGESTSSSTTSLKSISLLSDVPNLEREGPHKSLKNSSFPNVQSDPSVKQQGMFREVDDMEEHVRSINAEHQIIMMMDSALLPRMGRGQRKTIPNPKYMSEEKNIACLICSKSFGNKSQHDEHLKCHFSEKPYVCNACGKGYAQKRSLLKHQEDNTKQGCRATVNAKSKTCDLVLKSHSQLKDHMVTHSGRNTFICKDCNKLFDDKSTLEGHKCEQSGSPIVANMSTDEENKFICDKCGKGFKQLARLTAHQQTHSENKPFKCTDCGKTFSHQRTFKAHKHKKREILDNDDTPAATPLKKRAAVIKCETCGKEFTNRVHHEEHVRSHTGERPFQCVICGKGFATKRSLRNHSHSEKNARDRPHTCPLCPASFTSISMLKTHEKVHTGEKPFSCADCGKAYRSQHVYLDHINQHKGIKAHTCKECGKSFTWRTSLWAHSREHAKSKPFECVQCGEKFAEQSELKDHWEIHREDKPFQCPECGLGFMLQDDCDKHVELHKNVPSHNCSSCNEKFMWAEELRRHMLSHKEKKKCLCPTCGQTFSSKGHLKVHMLIHTGEKPYECETCHKRFYTRSLMRKHAVFHSKERPFECALCGDKFPTQSILRAHVRTHTGERPFSCEKCGKSFPQSTYLKRHMLTHSGERPFPCPNCDNAFLSRYDLKIHMRTHTGEKPFACDECEEQFYERAQLTAHHRSHTGERPFTCDLCGKGFNSSNHIKKHFGRVHPHTAPFCCSECGERFVLCEALRKHRKSSHLSGADATKTSDVDDADADDAFQEENLTVEKKDTLNRLIEDSQILVDETSNTSCISDNTSVLTSEFQIVQVNLVEPSQLIKLPEGFKCETVEVFHADSLVEFGADTEFHTVSMMSPMHEEIGEDETAEETQAVLVSGEAESP